MYNVNTIVIFGANGMLGNACHKYFEKRGYDVIPYTRADYDATKDDSKRLEELSVKWPSLQTVVINAMGVIPQRVPLTDHQTYIKVNSVFPWLLTQLCRLRNVPCFHITTDCVYSGEETGLIAEDDPHTEKGIYGVSKSCGEPPKAMIIRTSIIGEEINSSTRTGKSLLEWVRSQNEKTIQGYTNHFWNGVTTNQLARFIHECILRNISWSGVRHVTSPTVVSKYELVKMIVEEYSLSIVVEPFATPNSVNKALKASEDRVIRDLCHQLIPNIKQQLIR
jgi:dTDP-4-dehydrorhamnose reductase